MKKNITLLFLALTTAASAQTMKTAEGSILGLHVSANGKYVCGDSEEGAAFIWDIEKNTVITNSELYGESSAVAVSNNGTATGYLGDGAMKYTAADGVMTMLDGEDSETLSTAKYITPDGNLIVGANFDEAYRQQACIWKDGTKIVLPQPTTEELGFECNGSMAISASDDGSVIIGYAVDNFDTHPFIYWTKNADDTYTLHNVCVGKYEPDFDGTNPYLQFAPAAISGNGKWVSMSLMDNDESWASHMARYNMENGEITVAGVADGTFEEGAELQASEIANDGTIIGNTASRMGMMGRVGFIWKAGEENIQKLSEAFPTLTKLAEYETTTMVVPSITPDGKYIAGFSVLVDEETEIPYFQTFVIDTTADPTGINNTTAATTGETETTIYTLDGKKLDTQTTNGLNRGVYIIKSNNGKNVETKKVIVK